MNLSDLPDKIGDIYRSTVSGIRTKYGGTKNTGYSIGCVFFSEALVKDLRINEGMIAEITLKRIYDGLKLGPWTGTIKKYSPNYNKTGPDTFYMQLPENSKLLKSEKVYIRVKPFDIAAWFDSDVPGGLIGPIKPEDPAPVNEDFTYPEENYPVADIAGGGGAKGMTADIDTLAIAAVPATSMPPAAGNVTSATSAAAAPDIAAPKEETVSEYPGAGGPDPKYIPILDFIIKNPDSSTSEIIANMNIPSTKVYEYLKNLERKGYICRSAASRSMCPRWRVMA